MTYLVFDSETQIHKSHKRTANPFHKDNYVVLRGWKKQGDTECSAERFDGKTKDNYLRISDDVTIIVGHNIKFDLLYEMANDNPDLKAFYKRGGTIWCTQYAEYLLNAQQEKYQMVSMDAIAESYGGRVKTDGIKSLWEAGVQTADIDPDLLLDYLIGTHAELRNSGDIGNTEKIFLGQLKAADELGMMQGIKLRMDGLNCTTEMEFRGLKIDVPRAKENLKRLEKRLVDATEDLNEYTKDIPDEVGFNWGSNAHKSCMIFGGTIAYKKQSTYIDDKTGELARAKAKVPWPVFNGEAIDPDKCIENDGFWWRQSDILDGEGKPVRQDIYKSGKKKDEPKFKQVTVQGELKTKYIEFYYELKGYTEPDPKWKGKHTDGKGKPLYSVGVEVIDTITKRDIPFLKALGKYTDLSKEIGTYYIRFDEKKKEYVGMLTCVDTSNHIVNHSLNHVNTKTTRLSANNPNCQNIPRADKSEVKSIFVSRFGGDGVMGEIDYSQLEVVVQGLLSGDKNLIKDLIAKIDFHCKRVALKNDITYEDALVWCKEESAPDHLRWKKERTACKIFSFQRAYGAGATLISEDTGMPKQEVEDLIEKEDIEYSGIPKFNQEVESTVLDSAESFRDPVRGFRVFRRGEWQSPTGTMYSFRSYDAPTWMKNKGIIDTFKPTEMKNYPVQGTGGEIVQMVLGILWRWFVKNDNFGNKAFLVNTVHDCVWFDMHKDVYLEVMTGAKKIMEAVPHFLKMYFDWDCPVPFPVDAEVGDNMLDLHHLNI